VITALLIVLSGLLTASAATLQAPAVEGAPSAPTACYIHQHPAQFSVFEVHAAIKRCKESKQ
jgi:hypothetical protein